MNNKHFLGIILILGILGINFSIPQIEIISPTNGTLFSQCFLSVVVNATFENATLNRSVNCKMYYSGQFADYKFANVTESGIYTLNFTSLVNNGNYSVTCQAVDSSGSANSSTYTKFHTMTHCYAAKYKKNASGITTKLYSQFEIEHFDISYIVGILILGLALFGMVNYVQKLWKLI